MGRDSCFGDLLDIKEMGRDSCFGDLLDIKKEMGSDAQGDRCLVLIMSIVRPASA